VQAIATLSDGIKVNPLDTDMLLNRAGYYTCQGNFSAAIADYNLCLKHRPDTYEAWKYRGNVKFACGDLIGASLDYANALRIEPEDGAVLNNCGVCYMGLGNFEKSEEFINKASQLPDIPSVPESNLFIITIHLTFPRQLTSREVHTKQRTVAKTL
jgi:Tfp pilus assembly protein PilF